MTRSVQSYINRYKASWKTRQDVNSTIKQLQDKLNCLMKTRSKDLRNSKNLDEKLTVRNRYDNDIKFYDYLLYVIKLEYYDIIGKLKNV